MTQNKFTPGPWEASFYEDPDINADGTYCVYFKMKNYGLLNEHYANANLIAAAPDLLEALEKMQKFMESSKMTTSNHIYGSEYEIICAALSKARGEKS